MAHFAKLDENNTVIDITVVGDADTSTAEGVEKESIGQAFCEHLFGGKWVQTSYNANFRKNYAYIGGTYDAALDAFILPKPYPSWILNTQTYLWEVPTPYPNDGNEYVWNEETQSWNNLESI